jgi:hypothetical protein
MTNGGCDDKSRLRLRELHKSGIQLANEVYEDFLALLCRNVLTNSEELSWGHWDSGHQPSTGIQRYFLLAQLLGLMDKYLSAGKGTHP